ncbi:NblA/ycf18 family protein [Neosynechococcus sphagnicola]
MELTLEQEFRLRSFADLVKQMSREQAQEFLIEQNQLMMMREAMYRELLKQEWKLNLDDARPDLVV